MGSLFLCKHCRTQLLYSPLAGLAPQDPPPPQPPAPPPRSPFCDASMTSYTVKLIIVFIEPWLLNFSNIMFGLIRFYTTLIHCASFSWLGIGYCKALCVFECINCLACNRIIVEMHNNITLRLISLTCKKGRLERSKCEERKQH